MPRRHARSRQACANSVSVMSRAYFGAGGIEQSTMTPQPFACGSSVGSPQADQATKVGVGHNANETGIDGCDCEGQLRGATGERRLLPDPPSDCCGRPVRCGSVLDGVTHADRSLCGTAPAARFCT
jgi:hypothetical protein